MFNSFRYSVPFLLIFISFFHRFTLRGGPKCQTLKYPALNSVLYVFLHLSWSKMTNLKDTQFKRFWYPPLKTHYVFHEWEVIIITLLSLLCRASCFPVGSDEVSLDTKLCTSSHIIIHSTLDGCLKGICYSWDCTWDVTKQSDLQVDLGALNI